MCGGRNEGKMFTMEGRREGTQEGTNGVRTEGKRVCVCVYMYRYIDVNEGTVEIERVRRVRKKEKGKEKEGYGAKRKKTVRRVRRIPNE